MLLMLTDGSTHLLRRVLNVPWLRSVGKYSYAIYLFHQIVGQVMSQAVRHIQPPTLFGSALPAAAVFWLVSGFITFGLAWLSWQLFERRILALKRYFPTCVSVEYSTRVATSALLGAAEA